MPHHRSQTPYIEFQPGGTINAEDANEVQQFVKADLADSATKEATDIADLNTKLQNVDAQKFGGKSPGEWTDTLDKRYIKRDDPQAAGIYRRYFKQITEQLAGPPPTYEPAVIEHKLCRYPVVEAYELMALFDTTASGWPPRGAGDQTTWPFDPVKTKFLIYYASNRDPFAELLHTESGERFYWGDPLTVFLDQFNLHPKATQKLDDVLNDFWGNMFNTGEENDDFIRESYGHTPYIQRWIEQDKSVDDLVKGGQYGDLRVSIRPRLLSPGAATWTIPPNDGAGAVAAPNLQVYHLSQNLVELRATTRPLDLMVLLRT